MAKRGRIGLTGEARRDRIEDALFGLVQAQDELSVVDVRIRQAIRRSAVVNDTLAPALDRIKNVDFILESSKNLLARIWRHGQENSWNESNVEK